VDRFVIEGNRTGRQMMFEGFFILEGKLKELMLWKEINA
jgi:hypothetical protein